MLSCWPSERRVQTYRRLRLTGVAKYLLIPGVERAQIGWGEYRDQPANTAGSCGAMSIQAHKARDFLGGRSYRVAASLIERSAIAGRLLHRRIRVGLCSRLHRRRLPNGDCRTPQAAWKDSLRAQGFWPSASRDHLYQAATRLRLRHGPKLPREHPTQTDGRKTIARAE